MPTDFRAVNYKEYSLSIDDTDFIFYLVDDTISSDGSASITLHSHKYNELFYILEGTVKIYTEDNVLECSQGDLVAIPPNYMHRTEVSNCSQRIALAFSIKKNKKNTSAKQYEQFNAMFNCNFLISKNFTAIDPFKRFVTYYYCDWPDKDELIIACLHEMIILIKIYTLSTKPTNQPWRTTDSKWYRNYIIDNYFIQHFHDGSLLELSTLLHLSCQQTERLIKQIYNQSFREHIVSVKMNFAKNLLLKKDMSITQISETLGYNYLHNFYETFKKHFGVTPAQYRLSLKK